MSEIQTAATAAEPTAAKTKSNSVITTEYDAEARVLKFTVLKASETGGSMTLKLDLKAVSQANRDAAVIMGFKQRVSDAAAIPFNAKEKRYASAREKYDAMARLVEHYNSGSEDWSPKRAASGPGADELLLTQALCEVYPTWTTEAVRSKVTGMTRAERTGLGEHPKIRPVMERLRQAALTQAGVDADKLLAGFEDSEQQS